MMMHTRRSILRSSATLGLMPILHSVTTGIGVAQATTQDPPAQVYHPLMDHITEGSANLLVALHSGRDRGHHARELSKRIRLLGHHARNLHVDKMHSKLLDKMDYDHSNPQPDVVDDSLWTGLHAALPNLQRSDLPSLPPPTRDEFESARQNMQKAGLSGFYFNAADIIHWASSHFDELDANASAMLAHPEGHVTPAAYVYGATDRPHLQLICDAAQKAKTEKAKKSMMCRLVTFLKDAGWVGATVRLAICGADALISLGLDVATEGAASLLTAEEAALCAFLGGQAVRTTTWALTAISWAVC